MNWGWLGRQIGRSFVGYTIAIGMIAASPFLLVWWIGYIAWAMTMGGKDADDGNTAD